MSRTRYWLREAAITLALATAVFLAVQSWMTRDTPERWAADGTLAWLMPDGTEGRGTLADLRAQMGVTADTPVALHVWATWCSICRAEESTVSALVQDHPVITLATRSGDGSTVRAYLRQRGLPWIAVLDTDGRLATAHGWQSVPVFSVLGPGGALQQTTVGYTTGWGMRLRLWLAGR